LGSACFARAIRSFIPGGFAERAVEWERDPLAASVDAFVPADHLALQRLVLDLRVAGGHVQ